MKFHTKTYEPGEFAKKIKEYLSKCIKTDDGYLCKCGSQIRQGFVPTFPVDRKTGDVLDETETPRRVPYCDRCDPPDGFHQSYARRVFIYDR